MSRFFLISILLFVFSCSSSSDKVELRRSKLYSEKRADVKEPTSNKLLTLNVSGMSCEHACGGSIRMALKNTHAVSQVSFDFNKENTKNPASIYFDDSKISKSEIIEIVESLFSISDPQVKSINKHTESSFPQNERNVDPKPLLETSERFIQLPNLFSLFKELLPF
jgi:copper chaperone CopZ